jgi:hypothetical protein
MKIKIKKEDIILDAFLECLREYHIRTRREVKLSGEKVYNPYFWEQGEFVSIKYIDGYNNICYNVTQPGTKPTDDYHIISVAFPYEDYKPFHDKWMRYKNRENLLNELVD